MKKQNTFPILYVLGFGVIFAIVFILLQTNTGYPMKWFSPSTATYTHTATFTIVPSSTSTFTPMPSNTDVPTEPATNTQVPTDTPFPTETPTSTLIPTETDTPQPTNSPTPEQLTAVGTGNGFCRWGPDGDYLQSYVISENEVMMVNGRDWDGYWFWVQPVGLAWNCWVYESVLEFSDDKMLAPFVTTYVPVNGEVQIPSGVTAKRNGGQVTISWNPSAPAQEQHYFLQLRICSNGFLIDDVIKTTNTSITVSDTKNCGSPSSGKIRGADKRGYSSHVTIGWP